MRIKRPTRFDLYRTISKEKLKWSNEKPKLDNARRLRGIYWLDPEDKEFKETIKCSQEIGKADGYFYALQDKQEE